MNQETILDTNTTLKRRRELLPVWIKIFIWIFFIFGIFIPVGLVFAVLNKEFQLSLYGLETNSPNSLLGLLLFLLFILKFITAYGLWTERKWAIKLGKIDAILGIAICGFVMIVLPYIAEENTSDLNFRLELIPLIPYLIKMIRIQKEWEEIS